MEEVGTKFEPEAAVAFVTVAMSLELAVQVSAAISLKRIADAIEYDPKNSNLYDIFNDIRHNTRGSR